MQGKMPVFSRYSKLYRNVLSQGYLCSLSINDVWLSSTHSSALRDCLPNCLVWVKHKPHTRQLVPHRTVLFTSLLDNAMEEAHDSQFSCESLNTQLPNSLSRCSDPPCPPSQEAPLQARQAHHARCFSQPLPSSPQPVSSKRAPAGQSLVPC